MHFLELGNEEHMKFHMLVHMKFQSKFHVRMSSEIYMKYKIYSIENLLVKVLRTHVLTY